MARQYFSCTTSHFYRGKISSTSQSHLAQPARDQIHVEGSKEASRQSSRVYEFLALWNEMKQINFFLLVFLIPFGALWVRMGALYLGCKKKASTIGD